MAEAAAATFEEWIERIFAHDVEHINRRFYEDRSSWSDVASPPVTIEYMTRLFEDSLDVLAPFSDNQLKWGMQYIATQMPGKDAYLRLNYLTQSRIIQSFFALFEQLFMTRCWHDPFDYVSGQRQELNVVCWRWWGLVPIRPNAANSIERVIDEQFLDVIAHILGLKSDTCRESALCGLGMWTAEYSDQVHVVIDTFLAEHPTLQPELRILAAKAYRGFILTEKERDNLVERIEQVFKDTVYPGDDNLTNADHCGECAEISEAFRGKQWSELHDVKFLRYHESALSLFKPAAFHYYLPAFIRGALLDPESADIILSGLEFHLTPQSDFNSDWSTFFQTYGNEWNSFETSEQKEQLKRALDTIAANPPEQLRYFFERVSGYTPLQKQVIHDYLLVDWDSWMIDLKREAERNRGLAFWEVFTG